MTIIRTTDATAAPRKRTESRRDGPRPEDSRRAYSDDELDRMDSAFCAAMLAAIANGSEHCPVGVVTASGTQRPTARRRA